MTFCTFLGCKAPTDSVHQGIQPYEANPFYWEFKGEPVLLVGGSIEDNLFQRTDLEAQLNLLQGAGGNYVRNTMSSRDSGNEWPYEKNEAGLYDLNTFNTAYWDRFSRFLAQTATRGIIVQIEVWATFDYYDDHDMRRGFWQKNPLNPKNNVNYTVASSGLPDTVASHPTQTENPFFFSVPEQENNALLLSLQHAFVDQLLSYSLQYDHVLYCMDNETSVPPTWGAYWAMYIKEKAREAGKKVFVTEMWDPWDLSHEMHSYTFDHPETYDFVDVSQNNHNTGQEHWDNAQEQRDRILTSGVIRPMNNVKIYGSDEGRFGSTMDAQERFWRNIFGGMASARFHRPSLGLGINQTVEAHLNSAQLFANEFDVFNAEPTVSFLEGREENEAYGMRQADGRYAVLFPASAEVAINRTVEQGEQIKWLNILESNWVFEPINAASLLKLSPPGPGMWVALLDAD